MKICDALEIIDARYFSEPDPERDAQMDAYRADCEIGQLVYDLRTTAGLSQTALARKVGTTQSVISRLEDADYRGHTLKMLFRIARALGKQLRIQFADAPQQDNAPTDSAAIAA